LQNNDAAGSPVVNVKSAVEPAPTAGGPLRIAVSGCGSVEIARSSSWAPAENPIAPMGCPCGSTEATGAHAAGSSATVVCSSAIWPVAL
jgi:hypothetical protein